MHGWNEAGEKTDYRGIGPRTGSIGMFKDDGLAGQAINIRRSPLPVPIYSQVIGPKLIDQKDYDI